MIKRNTKKGFTIVELVIVIAVIAILAAVLIPTFSSLVKKANISADTQLCKNMNTALAMAKAEGKALDTMEDVLFAINEAGYVIENLNPTTEGFYYAWDSKNDQILFLNEELAVHYPENVELEAATCWVTVGSDAEADTIAAKGFALYLEPQFSDALTLANLVSVDAGVNTISSLEIASETAGTIAVRGKYNAVTLNVPNADVDQHGSIETLTVTAVKKGTLKVNGYVKAISIAAGKVVVNNTGVINTITEGADKINGSESKGLIIEASEVEGYTAPTGVTISNKAELEAFRDTVNAGYNYKGVTVTLTADIDLAGTAWLPIGNVYRKNVGENGNITGFAGTFDGGNHTVKNLSNNGFSVDGLASGRNESSVGTENEVVFGLFGCVYNAEIKNLTVNANVDDTGSGYTGDSVAAIVGFAYGESFTMKNCKATGSISGYDAIGGLVGRSYAKAVVIEGCTNEATVFGEAKTAGVIGYVASGNVNTSASFTYSNCNNSGSVKTSGRATGDYNRDAGIAVVSSGVTLNGTKLTEWAELDD